MASMKQHLTPAEVKKYVNDIRTKGYCVLRHQTNVWGENYINLARDKFMKILSDFATHSEKGPNRGANRYYMNIPPISIFLKPVEHPQIRQICSAILGADFVLENLGSDTPNYDNIPSEFQALHRDGGMAEGSLVVNVALTDQTVNDAPFQIYPGTMLSDAKEVHREIVKENKIAKLEDVLCSKGDIIIRDPRCM